MKKLAIIHNRVSTRDQARMGESLEDQEAVGRKIAHSKDAIPVVFNESYSGRKGDRPKVEEIIDFIEKNHKRIGYYIIHKIDRFTRGGVVEYDRLKSLVTKYDIELIDSYGIIQPQRNTLEDVGFEYEWSKYSPSQTAEFMAANYSNEEVRHILTRTIGAEIRLTKKGYHIGMPDDGFILKKVYDDEGKKRTIQIPDPERAHFFAKMFEMRASGNYSDKEIVKEMNALGYRSREYNKWSKDNKIIGTRGNKPLTVKRFQEIIKRSVYCGIVIRKWTNYLPVKAKYSGLTNIETFNKANKGKIFIKAHSDKTFEALYDYQPTKTIQKRNRNNPLFPYKNVVRCGLCSKTMMASSPQGKSGQHFPTYHCNRGHKYYGIPKKKFEDNIMGFLGSLKYTSKVLATFEDVLIDVYRKKQKEVVQSSSQISRNIADMKEEQATMIETLTQTKSAAARRIIDEKIDKLEELIISAQGQRNTLEVTESDIRDFIKYAQLLMEKPAKLIEDTENINQKQALFGLVFEDFPTYQELLNRTPKLSLAFELSRNPEKVKSLVADQAGVEHIST